jgi:hypothetical protein
MRDSLVRAAILGNSQAVVLSAAIKLAANQFAHVRCFDTFFSWDATSTSTAEIAIEYADGRKELITLDDFDLFVVGAGGTSAPRNEHLATGNHPLAHVACASWLGPDSAPPPSLRLASEAVFRETVYCWISRNRICELAKYLGEHGKCVLFFPMTAPNRSMRTLSTWALNAWFGENAPAVWRAFFLAQYSALLRITADVADYVQLLPYPVNAMSDGFMDPSLCSEDPFHGNLPYGGLLLTQLTPMLSGSRPQAAAQNAGALLR